MSESKRPWFTYRRIIQIISVAPGWWKAWATRDGQVERCRVPCLALCDTWESQEHHEHTPAPDEHVWRTVVPLASDDELDGDLERTDNDLGLVHDDDWDASLPYLEREARSYAAAKAKAQ